MPATNPEGFLAEFFPKKKAQILTKIEISFVRGNFNVWSAFGVGSHLVT